MKRRQECDQVARFVRGHNLKADQIHASMGNLDPCRVVDHMLYRACADRDQAAAFLVITYAVKRNILNFLLRAQILTDDLDGDLVRIFQTRNIAKDATPILLLKLKVLHGEDLP